MGVREIVTLNESQRPDVDIIHPVTQGRYQLVEQIGVSSVGRVFAARDRETDGTVAAKVFEGVLDGYDLLHPLRRYGLQFSQLSHPRIASVHSIFVDTRHGYLVRELVPGETLSHHLSEPPLSLSRLRELAIQVTEALAYVDGRRSFHGNLHPGNIIVTADGSIKVTDFGLARILREEVAAWPRRTKDGLYMAPEQRRGNPGDVRSDIYSLGVILWEAVTELPPSRLRMWWAEALEDSEVMPSWDELKPELPEAWRSLIDQMLAQSPDDRFQWVHDLAVALEALPVAELPTPVPAPSPAQTLDISLVVETVEAAPSQVDTKPEEVIAAPKALPEPASADTAVETIPVEMAPAPAQQVVEPEPVEEQQDETEASTARVHAGWVRGIMAVTTVAAVAGFEALTVYVNPVYGVVGHIFLLGLLLSLGAVIKDRGLRGFMIGMAVAPLIRILSLVMPLAQFPQPFWYVLTGVPLFAAAFVIIKRLELPFGELGLRFPAWRQLPVELLVAVSGLGLGWTEWHILHPKPIVSGASVAWIVAAGLILLVFTGFLEELLFRGLIQRVAQDFLDSNAGLLVSAALFTVLHIGWHSLADLALVAFVGLYFGFVVRHTRSLLGVTLAHGATNIVLFLVLPLGLLQ